MFTLELAKSWVSKRSSDLDNDRLNHPDETVQLLNRMIPDKSRDMWNSSCWLAEVMREQGASNEEVQNAQFAHGQRCFASDPFTIAVNYANQFIQCGEIEKSGAELALKINKEMFGND